MFRHVISLPALALIVFGSVACSHDDQVPPGIDDPAPTAREALRDRTVLTLAPDGTNVTLAARLNRGDHWIDSKIKLDVVRGYVAVQTDADDRLAIEGLRIELRDVVIDPETLPSNGLHLTRIVLAVEQPIACHSTTWSFDDQGCYANANLDLVLNWGIVIGDKTYNLGSQRLATLNTLIAVTMNPDNSLDLRMNLYAAGTVWQWANIVELSDLRIEAHGSDEPWVL